MKNANCGQELTEVTNLGQHLSTVCTFVRANALPALSRRLPRVHDLAGFKFRAIGGSTIGIKLSPLRWGGSKIIVRSCA